MRSVAARAAPASVRNAQGVARARVAARSHGKSGVWGGVGMGWGWEGGAGGLLFGMLPRLEVVGRERGGLRERGQLLLEQTHLYGWYMHGVCMVYASCMHGLCVGELLLEQTHHHRCPRGDGRRHLVRLHVYAVRAHMRVHMHMHMHMHACVHVHMPYVAQLISGHAIVRSCHSK